VAVRNHLPRHAARSCEAHAVCDRVEPAFEKPEKDLLRIGVMAFKSFFHVRSELFFRKAVRKAKFLLLNELAIIIGIIPAPPFFLGSQGALRGKRESLSLAFLEYGGAETLADFILWSEYHIN
jgi:hypothetical protein